jgi:hypothetical protein
MFKIPELLTAHDSMELLRRPMDLCVGGISSIAQSNQGKGCNRMVKKAGNLLGGHSGEKVICLFIIRIRRRRLIDVQSTWSWGLMWLWSRG